MFYEKKCFISHMFSLQARLVETALPLFNFCFVFKHIAKQQEAYVLSASRVFWVLVLHTLCLPTFQSS